MSEDTNSPKPVWGSGYAQGRAGLPPINENDESYLDGWVTGDTERYVAERIADRPTEAYFEE